MLIDKWDLAHICIAVDDLEAAMARYEQSFGMAWGGVMTFTDGGMLLPGGETMPLPAVSPIHGEGATMEGLREVWGAKGGPPGPEGLPSSTLELAHAAPSSPASTIWGCPSGQEYVHHIAYWVDDPEAESRHLIEQGYRVELTTPPGDLIRGFGYLLSPGGLRIELSDSANKEGTKIAMDRLAADQA